jgi:hypothetical protein
MKTVNIAVELTEDAHKVLATIAAKHGVPRLSIYTMALSLPAINGDAARILESMASGYAAEQKKTKTNA